MSDRQGGPTYREAFAAAYKRPLTWVAIAGGFALWAFVGFFSGLVFVLLLGGYSASRAVEPLFD